MSVFLKGKQPLEDYTIKVTILSYQSVSKNCHCRVAFEAHEMKENPKHLKEMALKYLRENHPEELAANVPSKSNLSFLCCYLEISLVAFLICDQ